MGLKTQRKQERNKLHVDAPMVATVVYEEKAEPGAGPMRAKPVLALGPLG